MARAMEATLRRALARLPGPAAQQTMAPRPRVGWDPTRLPGDLRPAAALLLIYPAGGRWHLPLTERAGTLRRHTGQMSLPGGGVDGHEGIEAAALREAREEIGVPQALVRILGRLTPLHVPVSGYLLHPVVGMAETRPDFAPDPREVARVLEVPLDTLQHPATVRCEHRSWTVETGTIEADVPYFAVGDAQVWGATAMVLAEFLALLDAPGLPIDEEGTGGD